MGVLMELKQQFNLLKNDNFLDLSNQELEQSVKEENSIDRVHAFLKLNKTKLRHPDVPLALDFLSENKDKFYVVEFNRYILPISYSNKSDSIILNLHPFHVDEVSQLGVPTVLAGVLYGMLFRKIAKGEARVKEAYYEMITNYMTSVMIRLFGKQYGLLSRYSYHIPTLRFFVASYILASYFGVDGENNWRKAAKLSSYNYKDYVDKLKKYDMSNILDFVRALSDFGVMPGLNKYRFTERIIKSFSINFLPSFEDVSRFFAGIYCSSVMGNRIVPNFIEKYNKQQYASLIDISRRMIK